MSRSSHPHTPRIRSIATATLKGAAVFWFLVAVLGQWLFVFFIASFYGISSISGNFGAWDKNTLLISGHIAGDTTGNLVFASHALMAAVITLGGTLQLVPQIRARALSFHRWNGRLFILTAIGVGIGGLYLIWIRGSTSSVANSLGTSLNATLIFCFAMLTLRHALARDIDSHRRWALRTFLVVNGVWFFRVGTMTWLILNQGPRWIGENFDGPFIVFWSFANYLLPLVVLELYLRTQDGSSVAARFSMAIGLFVLTCAMGAGIAGAFLFLWRPLI